ncbi:hypothetical protein Fmac_027139 [Flemingia macrophylla]|uniref:Uncharacterized protein n=1 Tax=Flemingia macrophylla TaxID=520843 RepID=A0ABD1LII6_9FABA
MWEIALVLFCHISALNQKFHLVVASLFTNFVCINSLFQWKPLPLSHSNDVHP